MVSTPEETEKDLEDHDRWDIRYGIVLMASAWTLLESIGGN